MQVKRFSLFLRSLAVRWVVVFLIFQLGLATCLYAADNPKSLIENCEQNLSSSFSLRNHSRYDPALVEGFRSEHNAYLKEIESARWAINKFRLTVKHLRRVQKIFAAMGVETQFARFLSSENMPFLYIKAGPTPLGNLSQLINRKFKTDFIYDPYCFADGNALGVFIGYEDGSERPQLAISPERLFAVDPYILVHELIHVKKYFQKIRGKDFSKSVTFTAQLNPLPGTHLETYASYFIAEELLAFRYGDLSEAVALKEGRSQFTASQISPVLDQHILLVESMMQVFEVSRRHLNLFEMKIVKLGKIYYGRVKVIHPNGQFVIKLPLAMTLQEAKQKASKTYFYQVLDDLIVEGDQTLNVLHRISSEIHQR